MGKSSLFSQLFSVNKSCLHPGCYESFQPGNYSGRKHSSILYCFWKRGLGFWHGGDLFSPGQNGKSDVVSETPIQGQERRRDRISLKPKGVLLEIRGKGRLRYWGLGGGQLEIKSKTTKKIFEIFIFCHIVFSHQTFSSD